MPYLKCFKLIFYSNCFLNIINEFEFYTYSTIKIIRFLKGYAFIFMFSIIIIIVIVIVNFSAAVAQA